MRNRIAGQRFKDDVGLAAPLGLAAGGDAVGVGKQDDLQKNGRIVGQSAGVVIAVLRVKHRQIQLVLDQVMNGVFKGAGLELFLVVDDDHRILVVVVVLETRHADGSLSVCSMLPITVRFGFFLQPQRRALRQFWSAAENCPTAAQDLDKELEAAPKNSRY